MKREAEPDNENSQYDKDCFYFSRFYAEGKKRKLISEFDKVVKGQI